MHFTPLTAISCGNRFGADPSGGANSAPRGMKCIPKLKKSRDHRTTTNTRTNDLQAPSVTKEALAETFEAAAT